MLGIAQHRTSSLHELFEYFHQWERLGRLMGQWRGNRMLTVATARCCLPTVVNYEDVNLLFVCAVVLPLILAGMGSVAKHSGPTPHRPGWAQMLLYMYNIGQVCILTSFFPATSCVARIARGPFPPPDELQHCDL